jgi:O-methyltransferase
VPARHQEPLTWLTLPVVLARLFEANRWRSRPVAPLQLLRMALTTTLTSHRVETASHYCEDLTMISAFRGMPENTDGVVVDCGCFRGGSTINLSLGCALAGRELHVYDSFERRPDPAETRPAHLLEEVRSNVERYGRLDVCSFHPGFFSDSMSGFDSECVLASVDVDLRSSLEDCVRALWPYLADGGSLFLHEARHREMVDFFDDQEWWREGVDAPGLIGGGTGLGLKPQNGMWGSGLAFTVKNPRVHQYATVAG